MDNNAITEIIVPRETASDDYIQISDLFFQNGEKVEKDHAIALCENSKTSFELHTGTSGYLYYLYAAGEKVEVGSPLALLSPSELSSDKWQRLAAKYQRRVSEQQDPAPQGSPMEGEVMSQRVSEKARQLIAHFQVKAADYSHLHLVREQDILRILEKQSPASPSMIHPPRNKSQSRTPFIGRSGSRNGLILLGGGGHAKMCIDILKQDRRFHIEGIIDSTLTPGTQVLGVSHIGVEEDLLRFHRRGIRFAVLAIGAANNHPIRTKLYQQLRELGFILPNVIHPTAIIEESAEIGEGNHIMARAYIGSHATVGNNCIINVGSIISHDSVLGDNVHLTPSAVLAGAVKVGDDSLIGMNATVYLKTKIGRGVLIGNSCAIAVDIADGSIIRSNS